MDEPRQPEDLRSRPFFSQFPAEDLEKAFMLLRPQSIRGRSSLAMDRHFNNRIAFCWSGRLRMVAVSPAGRAVTMFDLDPGDPFGFTTGFPGGGALVPPVRLMADTSALVLFAEARAFFNFAIHCPAAVTAFFANSAKRAMEHQTRLYELATLDSKTRVCCELLRQAQHGVWAGKSCTLRPRPSRAAIGGQISIAREAVSRIFKELAGDGVLSVETNGVVLHDVEALRNYVRQRSGALYVPPIEAKE